MPRTIDVPALKARSVASVALAMARYRRAVTDGLHYGLLRWIAQMSAVELHAIWERYAEGRLVAALNHSPNHFLTENNILGVKRVSSGLAVYVARGGRKYFDFRSMSDIIDKTDHLVGRAGNPFRAIGAGDCEYLDTLSSVRNCVVHGSDAAKTTYKRRIRATYGVHAAPQPDEFLHARDMRAGSPARYECRLQGLSVVLVRAIGAT